MIIVYSDKKTLCDRILPVLKPYYPYEEMVGIYPMHFGNRYQYIDFDYSKDGAIPFIGEPEYIVPSHSDIPATLVDNAGKLIDIRINLEEIDHYSLIYAGDPHYRDAWYFNLFLQKVLHKNIYHEHIDALTLMALDYATIINSYNKKDNFADVFGASVKTGEIRAYFNYLFNINSKHFFAPHFQQLGIESHVCMSKYMLQLLYFIEHSEKHYNEGTMISAMNKWKGTGQYTNYITGIGSHSSYCEIISNLKELQLTETRPSYHIDIVPRRGIACERVIQEIHISEKGQALLQSLPPQMQDADLPFKLALWAEQPVASAKNNINEYIMNFFNM